MSKMLRDVAVVGICATESATERQAYVMTDIARVKSLNMLIVYLHYFQIIASGYLSRKSLEDNIIKALIGLLTKGS